MLQSLLNNKHILAVDDEPDVLEILEEELEDYGATVEKATSYEEAVQRISSLTFDLVVLDIMGVRGFDLLEIAVGRHLPVVILTAHALSPQSLKKSIQLGARAYLPKDQLGRMVPFLEDVLALNYESAWNAVLKRLAGSFGKRFGPEWRKSEQEFWENFEKNLQVKESTIIQS
ncbi:MAG: response regulator [Thermodesulfobacteriota bacterium]